MKLSYLPTTITFHIPPSCPQMFDAPFMSLRFLSDGKTICVLLSLFPGLVRKGKINVRGSSQIARECVKATSEGSANKSRAWMFVGWVIYRSLSLLSQSRRKKRKRKFHRHSYKKKKLLLILISNFDVRKFIKTHPLAVWGFSSKHCTVPRLFSGQFIHNMETERDMKANEKRIPCCWVCDAADGSSGVDHKNYLLCVHERWYVVFIIPCLFCYLIAA